MLKKYMLYLFDNTDKNNKKNIFTLLDYNPKAKLLDLGCDEGTFTLKIAKRIGTKDIYGVDVVDERLAQAKSKGIKVFKKDINKKLPFPSNYFDVVHANQVIEHLPDPDTFAEEIHRILKPNGYAVISTESLSSWHNIFALILGYQAFSQHISSKYHIGNPLSPHNGEKMTLTSWTHVKIFSLYGLKEFFRVHKFKVKKALGSGYYPFPPFISKFLVKLDSRHSHYITIKAKKIGA